MGMWAEVKYALNSLIGTTANEPLNVYLTKNHYQVFKSDGSFTVPPEVYTIYVTAIGGGESGSNGDRANKSYGGNAGECIYKKPFDVTPGDSIDITIGKGGASTTTGGAKAKNPGTPTIIGNLITLSGGNSDIIYTNPLYGNRLEGGSITTSETKEAQPGIFSPGGSVGQSSGEEPWSGGAGGCGGIFGKGGNGGYDTDSGLKQGFPGEGFGSGGGAGAYKASGSSTMSNSGAGADGIVIIEWGYVNYGGLPNVQ